MVVTSNLLNNFNVNILTNGKGLITSFSLDGLLVEKEYLGNFIIPKCYNGENIIAIGTNVFSNQLKSTVIKLVYIPDGIMQLEQNAFADTKIKQIRIPSSLKIINCGCFARSELESILGSENIEKICRFGFRDCKSLKEISLKNCVEIKEKAFAGCSHLKQIEIPAVNRLGEGAFRSCKRLTQISIPNSCSNLPPNCFFKCNELKEIIMEAPAVNIGKNALYGTAVDSVKMPFSLAFYKEAPLIIIYGKSIKAEYNGFYNSSL